MEGGGLCSHESSSTLTGCVFAKNSTVMDGGAFFARNESSVTGASAIDNCTFSANDAMRFGAGVCWVSSTPVLNVSRTIIAFSTQANALTYVPYSPLEDGVTLTCCDLYGNEGGDWVDGIEDQADVNGNFSLDPRFCAEESDNLALMQCSPCAPGNHPDGANCRLIGALPVACPGTTVEETTWGRIKAIFR